MTNAARSEQGLAPLQWDELLAHAARTHADLMLQSGQLSHEFPGEASLASRAAQAGAHFQTIAENIGQGPSVDSIQHGWMNSPPHRANILDPNLNPVGFAVVGQGSSFYAVADFAQALAALSFDEIEAQVGKVLISRGVQTGGPVEEARKTCEMDPWLRGGIEAAFSSCAGKAPTLPGCPTFSKSEFRPTATTLRWSAPARAPTRERLHDVSRGRIALLMCR